MIDLGYIYFGKVVWEVCRVFVYGFLMVEDRYFSRVEVSVLSESVKTGYEVRRCMMTRCYGFSFVVVEIELTLGWVNYVSCFYV